MEKENWQQYYPTYKFKERDILLKEYESAYRNVESQERIFLNAINIILIVVAALGSLAIGKLNEIIKYLSKLFFTEEILILLIMLIFFFSIFTLKYFADRQKSIIFDSRKIVILRRMLDLDYGNLQLVIPNWRIEGANNPFAIKLFPGWFTYVAYPYWIIIIFSSLLLLYLFKLLVIEFSLIINFYFIETIPYLMLIIWISFLALLYRKTLYDTNERFSLSIAKNISKIFRLHLVDDFEYIIYRSKLAKFETERIKLDLTILKKFLIFIEDREFYNHKGISLKGLIRAFLSLLKLKRRSGGSTITQQMARTLFIKDMSKLIRRKIVEIILAKWIEKIMNKDDIIDIYISSVRFDYKIYGITDAIKHYFNQNKDKFLSNAEAFFLIERISNIKSRVLLNKIDHTIRQMVERNLLGRSDVKEIKLLYAKMVKLNILNIENRNKFNAWLKK